jgi:hypothetical protein
MRNKLNFLLFFFLVVFFAQAQTPYTDSQSGFTLTVPEGWTYESFESGEMAFRAIDSTRTAYYDVNLKKLEAGVTAKAHMEYLESFMQKAGYSQNFLPEKDRDIRGNEAKAYNADDIYAGAYTIEKSGIVMVQVIFVYRKGNYAYVTVQTCPRDNISVLDPQYQVIYASFKLI